jgi:hypothetical protein
VGQEASSRGTHACHKAIEPLGNGETLGPIGRRGAAAALERLEMQEERAHARLEAALARGDSTAIDMAQRFWLQCSETLRRLDLCVETVRRESEAQVSVREARNAVLYAGEWMRIAIAQFLSAEVTSLVAIKDPGEFKAYFFSRFKGVLDLTIKGADRTCSPLPSWAKESLGKESGRIPCRRCLLQCRRVAQGDKRTIGPHKVRTQDFTLVKRLSFAARARLF